jgi:PAS domain S-box-containing protein
MNTLAPASHRLSQQALVCAGLALAYVALAKIGLAMSLPPGYVTAIWPPSGLAIGACLVWGGRTAWPGIFAGSWLVNATIGQSLDVSWLPLVIAGGSTAQALLCEFLLRRIDPRLGFDHPRPVIRFSLTLIAVCTLAALVGSSALWLDGRIAAARVPACFFTWWLGDALGGLIFTPLTQALLERRAIWQARRISVGVPLLLAFLLCGLIYSYLYISDQRRFSANFHREAEAMLERQRGLLRLHIQALDYLKALFESNGYVSPSEFARYNQMTLQNRDAFRALGWIRLVERDQIEQHENSIGRALEQPYRVKIPPAWAEHPALGAEAAPVTYIVPSAGNQAALGDDFSREPSYAAALERVRQTGAQAMTGKIVAEFLQDRPQAVILFVPIRNASGEIYSVGFSLVELRAIASRFYKDTGLAWAVYDISDSNRLLHSNRGEAMPEFSKTMHMDRHGVYFQDTLDLAGRHWRLVLHKPYAAISDDQAGFSTFALAIALAASAMLGNFLLIMSGHTRHVEDAVSQRTRELSAEIEQRRRIEQNLLEAQRIAQQGSWRWELGSGEVWWSDEMYRIFGMEPGQGVKLEDFFQRVHPDDLERVKAANEYMLAHPRQRHTLKYRICRPDGETRVAREVVEIVPDEAGQPAEMAGTTHDITEHEAAEAELARYRQQLEGLVALRTEQLAAARDAAESARAEAEAANRAKSVFLSQMSHELRNPLNAIMGFAQVLLQNRETTPSQQSYIQSILRHGESQVGLLNDILDLAKIEAGRFELFINSWDSASLFQELEQTFRMRAGQKGIQFCYQRISPLPRILTCDEKRLRQIIMNLLGNAIKFTHQGSVTLATGFDGNRLLVEVKDSGVGIAANEIEQIFDPFRQAGDSSQKLQGSGLGLSITRKLVQVMNGQLSMESKVNEGSVFRVSIPAQAAQDPPQPAPKPPAIVGYHRTQGKGAMGVLIVDDQPINREILRILLEPLQFEIEEANNGEACLQMVQRWRPDVVLMDIRMPGMDGLETTRRLHQLPGLENLPVIALTAHAFAENREQSLAAGCSAYLTKPVILADLQEALGRLLPLRWIYQEPLSAAPPRPALETLSTACHKRLEELVQLGDISEIQEFAHRLQQHGTYPLLAAKIQQLAQDYDVAGLRELLGQLRQDGQPTS